MKPTHGQCDQYMAEGQPCSGYRRLEADLAAARALLGEARESWIKVGYGASHEDVADCSDLCRRIDAAIAGEKK